MIIGLKTGGGEAVLGLQQCAEVRFDLGGKPISLYASRSLPPEPKCAWDSIDLAARPHDALGQTGRHFYDSGPVMMRTELAAYLSPACAHGELVIDDYFMAADQFGKLCKADLWTRLTFGVVKVVRPPG